MKKHLLVGLMLLLANLTFGQDRYPKHHFSFNGFRNPSIGLEYHRNQVSIHSGYYLTNFESGVTTKFVKAGVIYWFLPWGKKIIPSSLYLGTSYLRGLSRDYKNQNVIAFETGARFVVWKGLNFRLGIIALAAQDQSLKFNPTPSINYTFKF